MEPGNALHQAIVRRRGTPASHADALRPPDDFDGGEVRAFTFGRVGMRPQMTLQLRLASGQGRAFPYNQLLGVDFEDEEEGFRLEFAGLSVEVRGRNLQRLLRYVCDFRAARIEQATIEQSIAANEEAEIVDAIVFRRRLSRDRPAVSQVAEAL